MLLSTRQNWLTSHFKHSKSEMCWKAVWRDNLSLLHHFVLCGLLNPRGQHTLLKSIKHSIQLNFFRFIIIMNNIIFNNHYYFHTIWYLCLWSISLWPQCTQLLMAVSSRITLHIAQCGNCVAESNLTWMLKYFYINLYILYIEKHWQPCLKWLVCQLFL